VTAVHTVHPFNVSFVEARRIQEELRTRVDIREDAGRLESFTLIGGVDVAFIGNPHDVGAGNARVAKPAKNNAVMAIAAAVVYDRLRRIVVETAVTTAPVYFSYVPGYLSFREGPAVIAVITKLTVPPDVIIYDGCGIMHPRGLGLASHMAVLTGIPGVGCAKSRLCGDYEEPGVKKGSWTPVFLKGVVVGSCLRTRDGVRSVFVSPGSGVGVDCARELVLSTADRYRLPEPTRIAHNTVTAAKREKPAGGIYYG